MYSRVRRLRGIFYCTDRRDSSLIIDAEKRTQVGLDAAGKTTILYKLKLGEIVTTIPTIGTFFARRVKAPPWPGVVVVGMCDFLRVFLTRVHSFRRTGGHFRFSSRRFEGIFFPTKKKKKHMYFLLNKTLFFFAENMISLFLSHLRFQRRNGRI